ncbi:MAG: alkaline phosphatase D family protein [Myxococcota bacterium]
MHHPSRRAALARALALVAAAAVPRRARAVEPRMVPEPVPVSVEVAEDEAFATVVARYDVRAVPAFAHSVHVDVDGLRPGRWYVYRFHAGQATSPVGRTRTADAPDAAVDRLRFAIASCQHFEHGWYTAHRGLLAEDLDLMLFLGDYIYEGSWGDDPVRSYLGGEALTLADYRVRHAQHKTDPALRALHAAVPWITTWDDHEVENDWAGDRSEYLDPGFLPRRAAAFQAYFEHLPFPRSRLPGIDGFRMHDTLTFGSLARFCVLDDRQHRDPQPCPGPSKGGGSTVVADAACPSLGDPARTMLGADQEAWVDRTLAASTQRWTILAQQTLVTPVDWNPEAGKHTWTDGWDGYPAARRRLLGTLKKRKVSNPVIVGGDVHASYVSDVRLDPADPRSAGIATEFCGTSITSQGSTVEENEATIRDNPQFAFIDGVHRGYVAFELGPTTLTARVRGVDTKDPLAVPNTLATFTVADGAPVVRRG